MAMSSAEIGDFMEEKIPEMDAMEGPKEKKKKKKEKKIDIEAMYSFDLSMIKKPKPVKKEQEERGQPSKKYWEKAQKRLAKIAQSEECPKSDSQDPQEILAPMTEEEEVIHISEPKIYTEKVKEDAALLRLPSPSRSRQSSPKKRDESPKKQEAKVSTSLNASASEFVPSGFSPLPKKISTLQANAAEFHPPGLESKVAEPACKSLQANAEEFVPPEFALKAATSTYDEEEKESPFAPLMTEASNEPVWSHAVFTPSTSLESTKQQQKHPAEKAQLPQPAQNTSEHSVDSKTHATETTPTAGTVNWTIPQEDVDSILGKVKQSLTGKLGGTVPSSDSKVQEHETKLEEMESENEAEKQLEAAIKAMNDAKQVKLKKRQAEMDETLMDCFLQAVKTRVKDRELPMMGTTLYGKHMRSSRLIGTDCDVKDSSFVWLRPFLESLEDDGLLELKPEVKDPTVIWINRSHPLICNWQPWAYNETVGYKKGMGKGMAKIVEKEGCPKSDSQNSQGIPEPVIKKQESTCMSERNIHKEKVKEDPALLRFPSPSRSRSASPKKRDESPKKQEAKVSTSLNASAFEFVPSEFSPLPKNISTLQANLQANSFYPPGLESKVAEPAYKSLQADAEEFVPPEFPRKVATSTYDEEQKESPFAPLIKEISSEPVWSHAVFTPSTSLESTKQQQQPAEKAEVTVPAQDTCEQSVHSKTAMAETTLAADKPKWTIPRMDVGSILGEVKQMLIGKLGGMVPSSDNTKDACLGKVQEKVNELEEMETENEAEKGREAAIKAMNDAKQIRLKKEQAEMDENLMECFLQAVKTHVKDRDLPMMGTTLYGKHMRSSRLVGTSCDVKDSSFVWLRPFLESLEDDGLLELKPEVKDPTVIWINRSHPRVLDWQPWAYNETVGYKKGMAKR